MAGVLVNLEYLSATRSSHLETDSGRGMDVNADRAEGKKIIKIR